MKRTVTSNVDFLSNLPDCVIENILGRLTLRDMVKPSILSREWRYKWLSCPELAFDRLDIQPVSQILERHQGHLIKFNMVVDDPEFYPQISQWVRMLPNHSLQNFTLHIYTNKIHRLTRHLFTLQNLRNLELFHCFLNTSRGCNGLSKLVSLDLQESTLKPKTLGKFVASCPALEIMRLNMCTSFDCLEITGPKLKYFNFGGEFKSVSFKNCPVLNSVKLFLCGMRRKRFSFDLVKSLSCLPSLEDLQTKTDALEGLVVYGAPNKLPIALKTLKNLNLGYMFFEKTKETSSAICFIRSCPNLERLTNNDESSGVVQSIADFLHSENMKKLEFLTHLRIVTIEVFSGDESIMEFVKYLLASTPALEEMDLVPHVGIMDNPKEIEILNKLKQYPRASPRVEIIMGRRRR